MIILDTDAISFLEHEENERSRELHSYLTIRSAEHLIFTTIITFEEQTRGWFKKMAQTRSVTEQVPVYARLNKHLKGYRAIETLDFDDAAAGQFQRLRSLKIRIGTPDLKIAAITLTRDAILFSPNLSDFRKVPNLRVEDWTSQ